MIVSGDPSGDLYGSLLVRALAKAEPGLRADAVGGLWDVLRRWDYGCGGKVSGGVCFVFEFEAFD